MFRITRVNGDVLVRLGAGGFCLKLWSLMPLQRQACCSQSFSKGFLKNFDVLKAHGGARVLFCLGRKFFIISFANYHQSVWKLGHRNWKLLSEKKMKVQVNIFLCEQDIG